MATTSLPTIEEVKAMIEEAISQIDIGGNDIDLTNITTDVLPSTSNARDIGSSNKYFAQMWGGVIHAITNLYHGTSNSYPYLYQYSKGTGYIKVKTSTGYLTIQYGYKNFTGDAVTRIGLPISMPNTDYRVFLSLAGTDNSDRNIMYHTYNKTITSFYLAQHDLYGEATFDINWLAISIT